VDFTLPYGFPGLEISTAAVQLKVGRGLALFTLSLCLPWKVALFFVLLHFISVYKNIFSIETNY
jgi:hypothetical protein